MYRRQATARECWVAPAVGSAKDNRSSKIGKGDRRERCRGTAGRGRRDVFAQEKGPHGSEAAWTGAERACTRRTAARRLAVGASDWIGRSARERKRELLGDGPVDGK